MSISCNPSALANAAVCFSQCISDPLQVRTYLLCQYLNACRAPLAPTSLALSPGANNPGSTTITVQWNQPLQIGGPTITGYLVKWGASSGNYNVGQAMIPASPLSYTITGLNNSTTYFIVVEAVATACSSSNSNELQATTTSGSLCSQATAWAARIVANGGSTPSNATLTAVCTYYNSLVAAGVDSLMIADLLFVPDNLIAAITPFFKTAGNDPWTNHNFVNADLSAGGLTGDGATKYLDSGIVDNVAWASGTENGIGVYLTPTTNTGAVDTGSLDINTSNMSRLIANVFASIVANCYDNANMSVGSWPFATFGNPHTGGFIAQVRQNGTRADIYAGNSVTAFSSVANTVTQGAGRPLGFNQFVLAVNNNGAPSNFTSHQLQWAGLFRGLGMTATKAQALFNAVQALQVALGRAQ